MVAASSGSSEPAVAPFVILPMLVGRGSVAAGVTMIGLLILAAVLIRVGVRTKDRSLLQASEQARSERMRSS